MSFAKPLASAPKGPQPRVSNARVNNARVNNACNPLPDPAVIGNIIAAEGAPPAATGGVVTDGTYQFAGGNGYSAGAPPGTVLTSAAITLVITAGQYDSTVVAGGVQQAEGSSGLLSFDGVGTASFTETCPGAGHSTVGYSFDGTTLTIIAPDFDEAYTLQP